ncbi:cleavage polyadenylation factor RNA-binding subunit YTH1 [Pneumocystis jirovecii RU7]|uniref:mRNA 3'-end-processing protein n=1 Tax=Pneumocystis jirovecii (strain RU7) TaxID=1408657 RepID=A0A0W4ZHL3_PNEJ7|nr:cleavage polyadenylation factor RNA-binding subunit YTH1 [Pneumocystis jirovecii RU7]KTW27861.1 hypothetical protein T551_02828 [Pneumocystis jirovecii RU7]
MDIQTCALTYRLITRKIMKSIIDKALKPDYSDSFFSFDYFLKTELRFNLDPNRPVCRFYIQVVKGHCPLGNACPDKHFFSKDGTSGRSNSIVCKHWLRGLCKKGDQCEFLHEYNLKKMPECRFFAKHGFCSNGEECLYLHIDPDSKVGSCPWYIMGFCPLGPKCSQKHIRKTLCKLYLTGFCPKGPECSNTHPKYAFPPQPLNSKGSSDSVTKEDTEDRPYQNENSKERGERTYRDLSQVECFKCGQMGHYANHCHQPKTYNNTVA